MGCNQSRIENEETVTRCKERKQYMKDAVAARNAFAAAHSAYAMALKNTGAALSDYAHGEVQYPSSPSSSVHGGPASLPQPPVEHLPPPPPPLPPFHQPPPPPIQRAASMPEMSFPKRDLKHSDPILEEENEDEMETESNHGGLKHRSSKSSGGVGSRSGIGRSSEVVDDEELRNPPSPPRPSPPSPPLKQNRSPPPPPPPEHKGMTSWDFFFPPMENVPGPTLAEVDEGRVEREELERKVLEERAKRSEIDAEGGIGGGDGGGGSGSGSVGGRRSAGGKAESVEEVEKAPELPPQPPQVAPPPKVVKRVKQIVPADAKRRVGSSVNLLQMFSELDDCFLKASESAHEVSKMLEAARLHYHSNFADNRGHIDHSARVMRVITWNRSFRGSSNVDDVKDDFDSEEHETHATVLDKMLAWEKKLYDEVKAGEQMKLEYQRKVASLTKLKKRDSNTEALERMKAAVSHLHTRYIVDMQSMDSTVSEINRLRDDQLYPKLVALVDGMVFMWESMRGHHESQSKIVQALSSLHISQFPKETSEHHHERTYQLLHVVKEWHMQFDKLIKNQKDYIRALNNWLKLNLIPIDTNLKEKVSSPQRPANPPICVLLHAWHDWLEKVPDELARSAINNFAHVVDHIMEYQIDEVKLSDKCKDTRRELTKKTEQFNDWYRKYMQRRTPPDELDPERAQDKDLIVERQIQVETLEKKLEEEEAEYKKQCIQVREKSLANLKTGLPNLFLAMSGFSLACSDMYRNLRSISQKRSRRESQ
ncbi:protein ALTERED PHOSPHATE STARVATION RESPONSE 1-like [Coffea arabica]|uniref:Protein ALTERED PHOSPHATE STARVATION RESPONSE 1-like n=1 Tax=Coffea arabica TaxID=13443 RepID=A0A6P6XEQ8_COFAR|nr:nitrate regulatory gene2 protein-like [Coffea arabica]